MALTKKTQYGSGQIFGVRYTNQLDTVTADVLASLVETVCVADNQIGYLKGGFDFKVDTENLSDQSDLGEMKIDVITKETGTCTFALFNANKDTIAKIYPTAHPDAGGEFVEVGGLNDMNDAPLLIIFKKTSKTGDEYAICVGRNMSGFENAWKQDAVTPFQCEFAAQPYSDTGRFYIKYEPTKYTVTYTLTTSQPDDWTTNYNDYYTKSGDVYTKLDEQSDPAWAADTYYKRTLTPVT